MRSGGILLVLVIVLVLGFGFYRGYLVLTSQHQPTTNNTEFKLTVDQDKVHSDLKQAGTEAEKATQNIDLDPN